MDGLILRAWAAFDSRGTALKSLKSQLQAQGGGDARRLSRLSLIAALGAARLRESAALRPDCAVYVATPFASPALFDKMADNVLNYAAAMPFDFIANLHNAPAFHAAQALGSSGSTLVLAAAKQPQARTRLLSLVADALAGEEQIALGFCHEAMQAEEAEGSLWLLLEAAERADAAAAAQSQAAWQALRAAERQRPEGAWLHWEA